MDRIYSLKTLSTALLFFSLITAVTSIIIEKQEPVIFAEDFTTQTRNKFTYNGNKTNLFVICNSSVFTKVTHYIFKLERPIKSNYSFFNYTYHAIPLNNYSYDYLNSLTYDRFSDNLIVYKPLYEGLDYEYNMEFYSEIINQSVIIKIPIKPNVQIIFRAFISIAYEVIIPEETKKISRAADKIYFEFTIFIICLICIAISACILCRCFCNKNDNYVVPGQAGQPLYVQQPGINPVYFNNQGVYYAPNLQNAAPGNQAMCY